jgi:hypothetical protein
MRTVRTLLALGVASMALTSCATEIVSTPTTTSDVPTTTTTLPPPEGGIIELLDQLDELTEGLSDEVANSRRAVIDAKNARAQAILVAIEPQIRDSGVDLLEDVQRIVGLIETATQRKRPADADKAQRFLALIREAAPDLLAN